MDDFVKFNPFFKIEDAAGGGGEPTVWGIATIEKADLDNEICDVGDSIPAYTAWSEKFATKTTGAGQQISLGNIRLQHGTEVGGKATKVEFRKDATPPAIWLGSEPLNSTIADQLRGGFYTGYSQGGSYKYRKCETCKAAMPMRQGDNYCSSCKCMVAVRYAIKSLVEVSYVDAACTGEGFEYVKADGSRELVKFRKSAPALKKTVGTETLAASAFAYVGDPEKPDTWALPISTKAHVAKSLREYHLPAQAWTGNAEASERLRRNLGAAAKANGIVPTEKGAARLAKVQAKVQKGMGTVSYLAGLIEELSFILISTDYEAEYEGDESAVPDMLDSNLKDLVDTFMAMAEEETDELKRRRSGSGEKTVPMTPEQTKKAAKSLADHLNAAKKANTDHGAKMADHLDKCAKAVGAMSDGDNEKCEAALVEVAKVFAGTPAPVETAEQTIARLTAENATLKAAPPSTPAAGTPAATAPAAGVPAVTFVDPAAAAAKTSTLVEREGEAAKGAPAVATDVDDILGD